MDAQGLILIQLNRTIHLEALSDEVVPLRPDRIETNRMPLPNQPSRSRSLELEGSTAEEQASEIRFSADHRLEPGNNKASEEPAIAMQTDAKQIHPDVANRDHHQTHHGNKGRTAPLPATAETGV